MRKLLITCVEPGACWNIAGSATTGFASSIRHHSVANEVRRHTAVKCVPATRITRPVGGSGHLRCCLEGRATSPANLQRRACSFCQRGHRRPSRTVAQENAWRSIDYTTSPPMRRRIDTTTRQGTAEVFARSTRFEVLREICQHGYGGVRRREWELKQLRVVGIMGYSCSGRRVVATDDEAILKFEHDMRTGPCRDANFVGDTVSNRTEALVRLAHDGRREPLLRRGGGLGTL
jgi:hypothetical protein